MTNSLDDVDALFTKVMPRKALLGSKNSKPKVAWEDMVALLKREFNADEKDLEVLKPSLIANGGVSKAGFERLNDHLGPIKKEGTAKPGEWTFSSIANLYRNEYFHGFLSGGAAQSKLSNLPKGSWLARFSAQYPKCIALSMLSKENSVEHWVATFDDDENVYNFEGETFPSLEALVESYKNQVLPGSDSPLTDDKIAFCLDGKIDVQEDKLGGGNFGQVMRATWRRQNGNKQDVAAKVLMSVTVEKKEEEDDDEAPEEKPISLPADIEAESNILKNMQHENIVRFFGMVFINEVPHIVTEIMNGGSLLGFLEKVEKKDVTPLQLVRMCKEAARGMEYLSGKDIVHRDLAARNLLVSDKTPNATVKVTDFGLSRKISNAYYDKSGKTGDPVLWAAPESFKPQPGKDNPFKGRVSTRSDRWSFGIILNEIFNFGAAPYSGYDKAVIRGYLAERKKMIKFLRVEDAPEGINTLIEQCTSYDSHKRPDFATIAKHLEAIETDLKEHPEKNKWLFEEKVKKADGEEATANSIYDEADGATEYDNPDADDDGEAVNNDDEESKEPHYEESNL